MDELFAEIDKSIDVGKVTFEEEKAAEGAEWLERIEEENAGELTPERLAALEAKAATAEAMNTGTELPMAPVERGQPQAGQAARAPGRGRLADGGAPLHPRLSAVDGLRAGGP